MKGKFRILLLIALLSTACSSLKAGNTPTVESNVRGMEPLAGIPFKPLSSSNARLLEPATPVVNQTGNADLAKSSEGAVVNPSVAAPMPPVACDNGSWCSYAPCGLDEGMSLISASEAETAGFEGSSFQGMLQAIVIPVVKAWASDARLTSTYGLVDSTGQANGDNGWHVCYVSRQRNESLDFAVTKSKTVIIRLLWEPLDLSPEKIKIDSSAALKILQEAIVNKETKSEEEKSGMDYFLQTPLASDRTNNSEVLYRIPADAQWNIRLQSILGHVVWEIDGYPSFSAVPAIAPVSAMANTTGSATATPPIAPSFWINDCARGVIDAEKGTLIRLTRPSKNTYDSSSTGGATIIPPMPAPSMMPSTKG